MQLMQHVEYGIATACSKMTPSYVSYKMCTMIEEQAQFMSADAQVATATSVEAKFLDDIEKYR